MKKTISIFILALLLIDSKYIYSQKTDSSNVQFSTSLNIISGTLNGEISPYIEIINKRIALEISAGKIFNGFNIIKNGGSGESYKYLATKGLIGRIGIKKYNDKITKKSKVSFKEIRYTYKNLQTPKYCFAEESNGLNSILREIVNDQKKTHKITINYGVKKTLSNFLFLESYVGVGINYKAIQRNLYRYGIAGYCDSYQYPNNTYRKLNQFWPSIEIGLKIGLISY